MNKKIVCIIIALSLFIISFTYIIYFINFYGEFSPQSSDWSNFGSYINSISPLLIFINIILIIYTVSKQLDEIKKQRESLYYPQIIITGMPFLVKTDDKALSKKTDKVATNWNINFDSPTFYCNKNDFLGIKMFNIGMGGAKHISISYKIDYNNIFNLINKKCREIKYKIENNMFTLKFNNIKQIFFIKSAYIYNFDFIIQSKSSNDFLSFEIPNVALILNSLYFYELRKNDIDINSLLDDEFISVLIKIQYQDITGKDCKNNYKLFFIPFNMENTDKNNYQINGDIIIKGI